MRCQYLKTIHFTHLKRLTAAFMVIIVIFFLAAGTVSAKARFAYPERIVRVGVSEFPHFTQENPDGSYSGIIIDYLKEMSKYNGWKIELVPEKISKNLALLSGGDIDLMGAMIKNRETAKLYSFAELSSGYSYSTVTAKKGSVKYKPDDFDSLSGLRVGIYTNATTRIDAFEQFCEVNGIEITPVHFDDPIKWEEAFATGAIDAQLTSSAKLRDDEEILLSFQQEPYHFAVTKGNTDIMRELNFALEQIKTIKPQFESELYEKYFSQNKQGKFKITEDEAQFIKNNPILRVVAAPDWRPISYFDKANGKYSGISADVFAFLEEATGFTFEYIQTDTFKEALDMLEAGGADLVAGIYDTYFVSDELNVTLSVPYMPTQTVILKKNETDLASLTDPILAMPYGFDYSAGIEYGEICYYDTVADCIDAVKKGKADFSALSNLATDQYIREKGKNGITVVPMPNSSTRLSIAYQKPTNPLLVSILDKAICALPDERKQTIVFQNTSIESNSVTLTSFIYANPLLSLSVITIGCMVILALLYLVMSSRLKLSRILTETAKVEASTDFLTSLHNKKHSEFQVKMLFEQKEILPTSAALIMDLDNFKQTNDALGHLGGDKVLVQFAKTLQDIFCNGEIVSRWGGDEFFVFVRDSGGQEKLEERVKRLCEAMDIDFTYEGITHGISISVGISFAHGKENFAQMFKAADEALYEKKRGTKNGYLFEAIN